MGCVWTEYPTLVMHHRESTAYRTSIGERDGPSIVSRRSVGVWGGGWVWDVFGRGTLHQ